MKASEIKIEFINTDCIPPLRQICSLENIKYSLPIILANNADVNVIIPWKSPSVELPKHNDEVLFIVKDKVRLGVFLRYDQWNRENIFCDGAFFFKDDVKGWMHCPSITL